MARGIWVNISSAWKEVTQAGGEVAKNVSSVWKDISFGWKNASGTWKAVWGCAPVLSGISLTISTGSCTYLKSAWDCWVSTTCYIYYTVTCCGGRVDHLACEVNYNGTGFVDCGGDCDNKSCGGTYFTQQPRASYPSGSKYFEGTVGADPTFQYKVIMHDASHSQVGSTANTESDTHDNIKLCDSQCPEA